MGSSSPEFQPSETITETTVGLSVSFYVKFSHFSSFTSVQNLNTRIPLAFHQEHLKDEKTLLGNKYLLQVGNVILIQLLCLFLYKHNKNIYSNSSNHQRPYPSTED